MHQKIELVRLAILKLLKPVVKLALNAGLKHVELDHLLRTVLLDEAKKLLSDTGKRGNVSQLAGVTGLHRKDLSARVKRPHAELVNTQMSVPSRVYTRWMQLSHDQATLAQLPVAQTTEQELSFEALVLRETKGDVHYKVVLDELERLGVVQVSEGTVAINPSGFVPSNDYQMMLSFLADNASDHLLAAVHNVTHAPLYLERSVFADGLSEQACQQLQKATRDQWNDTHTVLFDNILKAEETTSDSGQHRMRIGIYTYYEPMQQPPPDATHAEDA
jgi:Family of unknown function (DUF6502)